jgi:type I restriction enzyme M protein
MFVQHMLSVLKGDGKLATVMPHGVLFRGGEERETRRHFIERGWLEAVIGLPAGLFYGAGIPPCVLALNKSDASTCKHVVFINADRDYREGEAQTFLRAEDVSRIVQAFRTAGPMGRRPRRRPGSAGVNLPALPERGTAGEGRNQRRRRRRDRQPVRRRAGVMIL